MIERFAPIIQTMRGKNPETIVMNMIKSQRINNPFVAQLISYAKAGDNQSMLNLASNYFTQQGVNINLSQELQALMSMLK